MIQLKPHPHLIRRGKDIIFEAEINFPDAALGTSIKVPSLTGDKSLKVPPGTQSGTILRMRKEGMPSRFGKGDQLVHVTVTIPVKLTQKQEELIKELANEFAAQSNKKGWFRR